MNPNSRIFTSTYRVKWLKSKLTQKVKINIDENNLIVIRLVTLFDIKLAMLNATFWAIFKHCVKIIRNNKVGVSKMSEKTG